MAEVFSAHYAGPASGVVVTQRGQAGTAGTGAIQVLEAGHPVPDAASVAAAGRVISCLQGLGPDDRVIALVSGGGSALLAAPAPGITLADKQSAAKLLLASGATISEVNCVRRKLSAVKGGRLAVAAQPAGVVVLAISDVPGDAIADIASGPFSPDPTSLADARDVIAKYDCTLPAPVRRMLEDPAAAGPRPLDAAFARVTSTICARSADALAAAGQLLAGAGFEPLLMDDRVSGDAAELARAHAGLVRSLRAQRRRVALVTGGETTVRVTNSAGRGGRNGTYLLALAIELAGTDGFSALAADTDGIDGTERNAGAMIDGSTAARAAAAGIDVQARLGANDSWPVFDALGDLVVAGPTGTNANDLRVIVVGQVG